ncbi:hypothetical protein AB6A40_005168 [Gnathostoma spinigerum]|uniref:Galectin n=1 Tax=Gnathostoma spinigerum TaxID=75299 RepID=A0ABD6EJY0_9BILA
MKAIILIVFALSFVVCDETAESGASGHDPSEEKEKNYKKFIGETSYRMPFKTRLASPLKNGQTIHAVGTVDVEPKRIDFNFHKGPAQDSDLPLHLSCRYEEGLFGEKLVYNTFKDGHWEDNEQRVSNPFKANSDFDLRVRILNGTYKVSYLFKFA